MTKRVSISFAQLQRVCRDYWQGESVCHNYDNQGEAIPSGYGKLTKCTKRHCPVWGRWQKRDEGRIEELKAQIEIQTRMANRAQRELQAYRDGIERRSVQDMPGHVYNQETAF